MTSQYSWRCLQLQICVCILAACPALDCAYAASFFFFFFLLFGIFYLGDGSLIKRGNANTKNYEPERDLTIKLSLTFSAGQCKIA